MAALAALFAAAAATAARAEGPVPSGRQQARSDGVKIYIEQPGAHCASGGLRVVESFDGVESKEAGDTRYLCEGSARSAGAVADAKTWTRPR